ncbi:MAG TPA: aminotransferase class I/II-fold pyridoxal phosphate-dependent enzyme [Actinomycetes bacterium]|nr:aminotransferase class I/II-fold pyridoxal phosphate-dependent enzyme [Actinomycetes bacterium]
MTGRDRQQVRPYLGRAVLGAQGQVAGMPAGAGGSGSAPPSDRPRPRSELAGHVPYRSPRPRVRVRLDTNESPWPPPAGLRAALAELAAGHDWQRYGDLDAVGLRARLGEVHGHAAEGVWVAAGTWEVLQQVLLAFAGPGRSVGIREPTWGGYRHLAALTGSRVTGDRTAEVLVVCSPNNPTGEPTPLAVVAQRCQAHPASLVVVDEAYAEFSGAPSAVGLLGQYPNLAVVRSFSKALGLADLRLGDLLAHPDVVAGLERVRLPYHPSGFAQAAGLLALDHLAALQATIARVVAERQRVVAGLLGLRGRGVKPRPSQANFVCFAVPGPAAGVRRGLLDRGVAVRDVSDQPGLAGHLRVTVGTPADNDAFLAALGEVLP